MSTLTSYLTVFALSMVPVIELRGAVPLGVSMGLPLVPVMLISILGNMLPVPFILLFVRRVFAWMQKKSPRLAKAALWLESRAGKKASIIYKYEIIGLFIFVAIPLPGTGAWTGALIAALLDIRIRVAFPAIFGGVVVAGVLMTLLSHGVGALL